MTLYNKPRSEVFASNAPQSEIKDFTAWLRGLGIAFDETNGLPEMEGLNNVFNLLNQYIKYLEQNGFAEWSSDLEYPIGAGVRVGAVWYRAKARNINKPPANSQNEWELFLNANALTYENPLYIENNVIKVRGASQTQAGVSRFATNAEVSAKSNVSAAVNPANVTTIAQSTDLGVGQTWKNVTSSRALGITYTNNTARPIEVSISLPDTGGRNITVTINVGGVDILVNNYDQTQGIASFSHSFTVPSGVAYRISTNTTVTVTTWAELS